MYVFILVLFNISSVYFMKLLSGHGKDKMISYTYIYRTMVNIPSNLAYMNAFLVLSVKLKNPERNKNLI